MRKRGAIPLSRRNGFQRNAFLRGDGRAAGATPHPMRNAASHWMRGGSTAGRGGRATPRKVDTCGTYTYLMAYR